MNALSPPERPLNIAYLAQHFWPETGALPARISEMALRWQARGAEVTVITAVPHRPHGLVPVEYRGKLFQEERHLGIRVLRSWLYATPKRGFSRDVLTYVSFMFTGALSALLRAEPFDVLIASSPPFFVHPAGEFVRRTRRVPLVLELRDMWPDYMLAMGVLKPGIVSRALFSAERRLLRRADRVVVVSESFRDRVIAKGVPAERVAVVPNGVDTTQYFHTSEEPPFAELQRRPRDFVVGYLGNFGAGQALQTIVHAAVELRDHSEIRFVLAGDGPEKGKVIEEWKRHNLGNLVVLPAISKEQTRPFYNACDVCLVPLAPIPVFQETIPSKIFEIMACERPVLASLSGEGKRIVDQSGGGLVSPPGDAAALADAVLRLSRMSADERGLLGRRGREYVARNFDRGVLADHYLTILNRAAGKPSENVATNDARCANPRPAPSMGET